MSRKAFSSDLDSVFAPGAQYEPNIDASPWLAETATAVAPPDAAPAPKNPRARKAAARRNRKTFTSDLESLFAAPERPAAAAPAPKPLDDLNVRQRDRPRRGIALLGGIDSLIRDTTDGRAIALEDERLAEARKAGVPKRVTFTYDRDQFARLKEIAREEGAYLKDIISGLLNDYLEDRQRKARHLDN